MGIRRVFSSDSADNQEKGTFTFSRGLSPNGDCPLLRKCECPLFWLLLAAPALASADAHFGPFPTRDLTPFGYLRLDMRPPTAMSEDAAAVGTWRFDSLLSHQNTWALSPEVERYLRSFPERRELTPDDVDAIRALPGENYLVDLELSQLDFVAEYRFTPRWSGYAILSGVSYQGGFLDGPIETWHEWFDFSSYARDRARRNDYNVILDLRSGERVEFAPSVNNGLLDPTFGLRYVATDSAQRWTLVAEGAVKVPIGGERAYLSTGNTDVGLQVSLQRSAGRHAFYLSGAAVYFDGSDTVPSASAQVVPTLNAAYEFAFTANTHAVGQVYASRSIYDSEDTGLRELLDDKYLFSLGLYHRSGSSLWSLCLTENPYSDNNTPDFGFQFGWSYRPARR